MDAANGTELATLALPQSTPNNGSTPMTTAANSTQNLLPLASTASNLSTPVPAPTSTLPAANGVSSTTSPPQPASSWRSRGKERFTLLKNSFRSNLVSIKERFQLHLASIKEFFQPHLAVLKYAYRPTIALLIYSFTLYTVYTAPSLFSPLGRVDPDYGIWLLAALGKVGDISFAFAVEDAFDTLAWRKLKKRQGVQAKMGLMLWMSLLSSTGFEALVKMVWRGLRRWKWWRRWKGGVRVPVWERWKDGKEVRWSLTRLVFLSILIPGPGIILLGKNWLSCSGGRVVHSADYHDSKHLPHTRLPPYAQHVRNRRPRHLRPAHRRSVPYEMGTRDCQAHPKHVARSVYRVARG